MRDGWWGKDVPEVRQVAEWPAKRMTMSAPLQDLLGLWRGDEDSTGYVHEGLAREICRKCRPNSELELVNQLYPGVDQEDVAWDAKKTITVAYRKHVIEKGRTR